MPRLRKSKQPAVPTPAPPPEQQLKPLPQRDSGTLITSSTSVTPPSGSAFYDVRDPSSDGAIVRGKDADWRAAYDAARMALEIAKESSDMFLPLKAVAGALSVLMKNYDQTEDNTNTIKEMQQRVLSLSSVLASPVSEDDYAEKWRRSVLRRKLEGVIVKLEPLSKQHAFLKFLRNANNAKTLTGFIQELADAITDYQVLIQQGVYERTRNIYDDTKNILEAADLDILAKLGPVYDAGYQAGHHDQCLPGTRESVLQDIVVWARSPQDQNVFWLNGLAGTGKSTITQSFSGMIASEGLLGASFFCSRDYLDRKQLKNIFPTLAYQLACHYPPLRAYVVTTIKKDPTIAHTSLISQLENLLINPLSEAKISCVIVIDALDECVDDQPASAILSVLARFVKQVPLVKFFITGRPEPRIRTGFRLPLLQPLTQIFLLHEVEPSSVDSDIQLYLTQRLTTIAKERSDLDLPNPWPHDHEIEALTEKSSGLFIFASTLTRFIGSEHHEPNERLQLVLSKKSGTIHEGRTGIVSLYSQVLLYAFLDVHELEVFSNVRRVLGAIVLAFNPLSQKELSEILSAPTTLISTTLRHLHSVLLVPADESKEIRIFHKSFPDFLQDHQRCTDPKFHIKPAIHHSDLAISCLELVKTLKGNPCSLPPFTMNQDITNAPQLLENKLGSPVRYACSYWARHLILSPTSSNYVDQVIAPATSMLKKASLWIEVMSLENQLEGVIHSMYDLLGWLDRVKTRMKPDIGYYDTAIAEARGEATAKALTPLYDLATDCLRLSMHFFHPIQRCAQHVYHTAVPLSPTSSQLRKASLQTVIDNQLSHVKAFSGAPSTWGLLLRTIDVGPRQATCIATSVQRIIAACEDIVNIYNAVTGVLQQFLHAPETVVKIQDSPDGATLFFVHSFSVTMWDVQTGGLIHTFTAQSKIKDIAVSATHLACSSPGSSFVTFWNIHTKEEDKGFSSSQPVIAIYWVSPQDLVVVTQNTLCIYNMVVGGTLSGFSVPGHVWGMVYLQDKMELLVGTSQPSSGVDQEESFFIRCQRKRMGNVHQELEASHWEFVELGWSPAHSGRLLNPTLVGEEIACITPTNGVRSFNTRFNRWTNNPPLLDAAKSVAVSLNRNLVVQTKDYIQIYSVDVLGSGGTHNDPRSSHIYPLGKNHIICLQPTRQLTLLELETLREFRNTSQLRSLFTNLLPFARAPTPTNQSPFACASLSRGLVVEFGLSAVMEAWQSGTPLPERKKEAEEGAQLCGWPSECTRVVAVYNSPRRELRVKDARDGTTLADLPLGDDESGDIYDITFDSETAFHLAIDQPERHIQIRYDIIASPSGRHTHTITRGGRVRLLEPRTTSLYTLDVNCEWVLDGKCRKVCWISPGDIRRGDGGHFWVGSSLVMLGDDGVVKKLTFKDPGC